MQIIFLLVAHFFFVQCLLNFKSFEKKVLNPLIQFTIIKVNIIEYFFIIYRIKSNCFLQNPNKLFMILIRQFINFYYFENNTSM